MSFKIIYAIALLFLLVRFALTVIEGDQISSIILLVFIAWTHILWQIEDLKK